MSKEKAIAEFEAEQAERDHIYEEQQAALRSHMNRMRSNAEKALIYAAEVNRLDENLMDILKEDMDYVASDQTKMKIGGEKDVMGGPDGKTIVKHGVFMVFEDEKFKGKPFYEASREMHQHFRIYCLVNGMTENDLLEMAKVNPSPETVQKIRGMKKGFFDMITSFVNPALGEAGKKGVYDYYYGLARLALEKAPELLSLDDPEKAGDALRITSLMFSGADSYISQTLKLGDTEEPEFTKEISEEVKRRFAKDHLDIDLHNIWGAVSPLENIMNFLMPLVKDKELDLQKNISDREVLFGAQNISRAFRSFAGGMMMTKANNKNAGKEDPAEKKFEKSSEDMEAMASVSILRSESKGMELLKNTLPGGEELPMDLKLDLDYREAGTLYTEMSGNVRKNIFGRAKANSDEYDDIVKALEKLGKAETKAGEELYSDGELLDGNVRELNKALRALLKVSKKYTDEKDPSSRDGIARYKMALRAQTLAARQLKELAAVERRIRVNLNAPDKKLGEEVKARNDVFEKRQKAVDENAGLSKQEKDLETEISSDLYAICMELSKVGARNKDKSLSDKTKQALTEILGRLAAKVSQRTCIARSAQPMTDEQMSKLGARYIREGVAERMIDMLPKNQADIAGMTSSDLFAKVTECGKAAKAARDKAEAEQMERRIAAAGEAHRQAEEFRDFCHTARSKTTWGFTQDEADRIKTEANRHAFSIDRSMIQSLALGLMLKNKDPEYTVEKALTDPELNEQRAEFGRKAIELIRNDDMKEIANALYIGGRKTRDFVNSKLTNLPEFTALELRKPENRVIGAAGEFLYDFFQEFNKARGLIPEGTKMEYQKDTADRLEDNLAFLGKMMMDVSQGNVVADTENLKTSDLTIRMRDFVTSAFVEKVMSKAMQKGSLLKMKNQEKLLENLQEEQIRWFRDEYDAMSEMLENPEYTRAFAEAMQDGTLKEDMKMKVKFEKNGTVHMSINLKSLEKNLKLRAEIQKKAEHPELANQAQASAAQELKK